MNNPVLDEMEEAPSWRQRVDRILPFLIGISLTVALGALLYYASLTTREQNQALAQQQRSYEIVTLARRLDATIAKAESTLARYVISMDKDIGREYQDKWQRAGTELSALRRVTRDDQAQHALIEQLEAAYSKRGETLNDIALRTNYDQKETSLGKYYQASRAESLTRITTLLERLIATENERLRERNLDVERTGDSMQQATRTYRLAGLALLVALLTLGWFARAAVRERRQEQRMIDDEYHRAQALEKAVASRTQELELAYTKLQQESADKVKAEESLRQMQKMEAVGQLTGGIAHDFNNMLTVVVGGLELARKRVEGVQDVVRHIDNAMEGANRASALTRRLLAFARSEPDLPDALRPDELMADMIDLVDRSIGDQIKIELDLHAADWTIYVDQHQLENVILNLAVNARDAMEGRGTITIKTSQNRLRAREIGDCAAGEYICMSVIDDGHGMSAEVLDRVFEPFYTTKDIGKGTGLGLSQVFGFVRQNGGEIRMLSTPGEGTEVQIYLPRHHGAEIESANTPPSLMAAGLAEAALNIAPEEHDTPSLSILLVEDDPRVLAQTRSALSELGHRTICCDHPHKAEDILKDNNGIELILSDVLMPDMTGPEMIAALPAMYRTIPVIFVTGYAGEITDNSIFEGHMLLRKPYTLASLKQAIALSVSQSPSSPTTVATA